MRFKSIIIISFLLLLIGLLSGCTEPEMTQEIGLTVLGVSGESKEFTLTDIKELTSISGTSKCQNSFGNWRHNGVYRGVPISDLAEEVGGIQQGDILTVTSEDDYTQIFTYENIYPSSEWEGIQGKMILAYEFNDTKVPKWEDGLRIVFLPSDEEYSTEDQRKTASLEYKDAAASVRWAKWVTKLEFIRENEKVTFETPNEKFTLSHSQLQLLPSIEASGAFLKTTGVIVGPYNYKGVNMTAALDLLLDFSSNFSMKVVPIDFYNFTFTKSQIFGNVPLFDENGVEIGHGGLENLTLTLIYEENGEPLQSDYGGPFRMGYLGPGGPISEGHFWVKYVKTIIIGSGITDWSITLSGVSQTSIGLDDFNSVVYCGDHVHNVSHTYSEAGRIITYEGMPLWIALSMVDGDDGSEHYTFNDSLAAQGYNVTIFSSDGTNLTLPSSITTRNNSLILAHVKNNLPLPEDEFPVRLVSPDLSMDQWISKIESIIITDIPTTTLHWTISLTNQINSSYTAVLTAEEYLTIVSCKHHKSSLTIIEDDKDVTYVGIPLYVIVAIFDGGDSGTHYSGFNYDFNDDLASTGYIVQVKAQDGYSKNFDSQMIAYNKSIILAYRRNGVLLDEKHTPLRLIGLGFKSSRMIYAIAEILIIPN
ncbi:MAG: hypothetical protein ACFFB5_13460 [Promethearchaeota archaeon]